MRSHLAASGLGVVIFALAIGAASATSATKLTPTVIKDATGATYTGDATAGEKTFRQCIACHKMEPGKHGIGPALHGIVGRKAGTQPGYVYSGPMKKSGITWNEQALSAYLENPRKNVPGTKMTYAGLRKAQDRANVIAYMKKASLPK